MHRMRHQPNLSRIVTGPDRVGADSDAMGLVAGGEADCVPREDSEVGESVLPDGDDIRLARLRHCAVLANANGLHQSPDVLVVVRWDTCLG